MAGVRKSKWDTTFKRLAGMLSAGAALVSIASFVAGRNTARSSAAAAGLAVVEVSRIDLSPSADTAYSLGDTLHITTLAADVHGQALRAAAVHWTVDDPAVAQVDSTGQVVVRGPGVTGVTVAIGGRAGRARIWVLPRVTALAIAGDSVIRIPEGATLELHAVASDARGNRVDPGGLGWSAGDVQVAAIDSSGTLRGVAPGTTTVAVATAGLAAERRVDVMPVPASITLTAGGDQRAAAGRRLSVPVAVQVVSRSGRPVADVVVRFDPSAGVGRVEPDSTTTDGHGVAVSRWTLGPLPGRQRLAVEVAGIDSALMVAAEADPTPSGTRITMLSDSVMAEAGATVAEPIAVQVTDSNGVVLADVPVAWRALDGGSFALADARTDSLGVARAHWHLGPRAGRQRAKVQVGNARTLPPFALSATATPGAATSIVVVSGDAQRGLVGSALARGVVIRALDSLGNPVSGAPIHLSTRAGKVDSVVRTGTDGVASARWTLGGKAGSAQLVAWLDGNADSVLITATGRPGAAKTIDFVAAPASGTSGRPLPKPVQIVVRDRYGNPVPKVAVQFTVTVGKTSPLQGVTDSVGRVITHWTLGPKRGKQVLTASVKAPALRASQTVEAVAARN